MTEEEQEAEQIKLGIKKIERLRDDALILAKTYQEILDMLKGKSK